MFRKLLWKEWHENRWKLVFCTTVSIMFSIILFRIRLVPDLANCVTISFAQMFMVPVIYALDIFSGEMSNRTIHLLFKIPVPRWKIFFSKFLTCLVSMSFIFIITSLLMELIVQGRETETALLLKINLSFGAAAIVLFAWFCVFGAQSHSEASSLAAIFGVMIGWAIIFLWASICMVPWAFRLTPYCLLVFADSHGINPDAIHVGLSRLTTAVFQVAALAVVITIACYRFVKVRRYL